MMDTKCLPHLFLLLPPQENYVALFCIRFGVNEMITFHCSKFNECLVYHLQIWTIFAFANSNCSQKENECETGWIIGWMDV